MTDPEEEIEEVELVTVTTRPATDSEQLLRVKFAESIVEQKKLMDDLAKQLITIELAIPGMFATALALVRGLGGTVTLSASLLVAFGLWLASLVLTLFALVPRDWSVDPEMLKSDPRGKSESRSIEEFFRDAARWKRWFLIPAIGCFCFAIAFSVRAILIIP